MKAITELEFHTLFDAVRFGHGPGHLLTHEQEWWSDQAETVIGAVCLDLVDHDWSFVILGRDEHGDFRGIDLGVSLPTIDDARSSLLQKMDAYSNSGRTEFPQE